MAWPSSFRTDAGDSRLRIQGCNSAGRGMFPTEDACNGLLPVTTGCSRTVPCRGLLHFRHDTCAVTLQCGHNRKAPIDGHRRRQASSDTDKGQGRKVRMPQLRHHDIFPFYPSCPFIIGTLRLPHTQTTASSNIRLAEWPYMATHVQTFWWLPDKRTGITMTARMLSFTHIQKSLFLLFCLSVLPHICIAVIMAFCLLWFHDFINSRKTEIFICA